MDQGERKFLGCSQDVFTEHGTEEFCTRDNWQTAVLHLAQEMEALGLASPCSKPGDREEAGQASLDVITLVNSSWTLVQMLRTCRTTVSEMEGNARRTASDRDRLALNSVRQREALEARERLVAEASEKERQATEQVECTGQKLKMAREEVRRLMSVLLQREAKYSHEIRRAEQESSKLKERLLKVLVEKGEGRGTGVSMELNGPCPGGRAGRGRWNTEQSGKREEELLKQVLEEVARREEKAANLNQELETALLLATDGIRDTLVELDVDLMGQVGPQVNTRSGRVEEQTRTLLDLLQTALKKVKKPSDSMLLEKKMSLYEEKMTLYEQILANYETSKEKQDWIVTELKNLQTVSKESLLVEQVQLVERQEESERLQWQLDLELTRLAELKVAHLTSCLTLGERPSILSSPRQEGSDGCGSGCGLPSWVTGPIQITPSPTRPPGPGGGQVLGYSGPVTGPVSRPVSRPASRPGSRPGSQPGSRAPSIARDRTDKGKSPAASLISKRSGSGRLSDGGSSSYSLGRSQRNRPKSANISPTRLESKAASRRSVAKSRSPSRARGEHAGLISSAIKSSLSLPRNSTSQLNLRSSTTDRRKRTSGVFSKPPTPGPLSPATSDSEAGMTSMMTKYETGKMTKSSTMPFDTASSSCQSRAGSPV